MRGFNKAIVMGNLARDPEVRYTATKQTVAKFSVAVNRRWKGANGEVQEQVDFIPVVVWGAMAELAEKYLTKGAGVLVEGRISVRSYEKDGQKRYATEIVAQSLQFVGGGKGASSGDGEPQREDRAEKSKSEGFDEEFPMDDQNSSGERADIPF